MKYKVEKIDDIILIKIIDNFHFGDFDDFSLMLNALSDKMPNGKFLFDLSLMPYITSAIIGKFVSFIKEITKKGAVVKFCCLRVQVKTIFEVTGLLELFDIYDTLEDAIKRF
jgi:anti-anti-sigma factor